MTEENEMDATLIPTLNLLDYKFHYFYVDSAFLADDSASYSVSGCATEVKTKYQSIFILDTFLPIRNNK